MSFDSASQVFFTPEGKFPHGVIEMSRLDEQTLRKMNAR
jgi:hypothetical protein